MNAMSPKNAIIDLSRVAARAAEFGFRRANDAELAAGITIAESLMGSKIASPHAVRRMDDITQMTAWVTGEPVEGVFLTLPLTRAGELAVRNGTYEPGDPDEAHLCKPGAPCSAFYIGVYAGATRDARRSIMTAAAVMRVEIFSAFPCFARAATEDGLRSMLSLGFHPIIGGLPDLYGQEPLNLQNQDAA
jgi:hypothetical protein